ncbi:MAG: putative damage-inducible protein DinB [Myxococcota bacterium]
MLADLTPEQIQGPCRTVAGAEVPVWLLLRVMIEHEIHHRGQLYTLLGLLDVERPSLFGLTEREVFEASSG